MSKLDAGPAAATMRAARFVRPGDELEITSVEIPPIGSEQCLVAVRAVGLCGSDLHIMQGHTPTSFTPITIGHEIAGEVVQVGSAVTRVVVGDRVFVNPIVGCGVCHACSGRETNFCDRREMMGIQRDGGLAEYLAVPAENVTPLPNEVDYAAIALIESAGTAHHALRVADLAAGDSLAIVGIGGLGTQVLRLAVAKGIAVTAIDPDPVARERALVAGAKAAFAPSDPAAADAATLGTPGHGGLDAVIDCVGSPNTAVAALGLLRMNGRCVVIGIGDTPVTLTPPAHFMRRSLHLSAVYAYTERDIAEVAALLAARTLDLQASVTSVEPLTGANRALERMATRTDSPVRIVIDPSS